MNIQITDLLSLVAALGLLLILERVVPLRPSADASRARYVVNSVLSVLTVMLNALLLAAVAAADLPAIELGFGWESDGALEGAIKGIAAIALLDFTAYVAHVLMHKIPVLWRLHVVHHADTMVDVTTGLRQHPVEALVRFTFTAVPVMMFGIPPEVAATYRVVSAVNALLEHANLALPARLEPIVRAVLVTPAMHKVHHSRFQPETDSNYGNIFLVFDRLLRTYRSPAKTREPANNISYGLDTVADNNRPSLIGLLALKN